MSPTPRWCLRLALLLAVGFGGIGPVSGVRAGTLEYQYDENVADFLEEGTRHFKAGRFREARLELENVLLIAPGSPGAHDLLVRVYHKLGETDLARRLLRRIRQGRLLGAGRIGELEAEISSGGGGGGLIARGSFWDGGAPALPPPGAATPSGERRLASVGELEDAPLESGLDNLLDDLEDPIEDPSEIETPDAADVPPPPPPTQVAVQPSSDPRVLHAQAVGIYKRTGSAIQAGALLVKALEQAPDLLAEPDGGLFDATFEAYSEKVEADPDNLDARFVLAFLREKRGEEAEAVQDYERIAAGAQAGSRLARVAKARADVLLEEKRRREAERQAMLAAEERARREAELEKIAQGEHSEVTDWKGFQDKGRDAHKRWSDSRDDLDLRAALAWYQGAIVKEPGDGENHYLLALVHIDRAAEGGDEEAARTEARESLERCLTLSPSRRVRQEAENLLKALTK